MALIDRKIPILTGINDTPSTEGQANHPNASLLCKQYNDLIDTELTVLQQSIVSGATNKQGSDKILYYWIDADNGDDNSLDPENDPIQTFAELHRRIASEKTYSQVYIYLSGTFVNPDLDFSKHSFMTYDESNLNKITFWDYTNGVLQIDNNYHLTGGGVYDDNSGTQIIRSNIPIVFDGITFEFTANSALLLDNLNITLYGCNLDATALSSSMGLLYATNSIITLDSVVVTEPPESVRFFLANNCKIFIANSVSYAFPVVYEGQFNEIFLDLPVGFSINNLDYSTVYTKTTGTFSNFRNSKAFLSETIPSTATLPS